MHRWYSFHHIHTQCARPCSMRSTLSGLCQHIKCCHLLNGQRELHCGPHPCHNLTPCTALTHLVHGLVDPVRGRAHVCVRNGRFGAAQGVVLLKRLCTHVATAQAALSALHCTAGCCTSHTCQGNVLLKTSARVRQRHRLLLTHCIALQGAALLTCQGVVLCKRLCKHAAQAHLLF